MKAGDSRVNEVPNLSLLHTIFMREHNRIADNIARSEGGGDEQIFQVFLVDKLLFNYKRLSVHLNHLWSNIREQIFYIYFVRLFVTYSLRSI